MRAPRSGPKLIFNSSVNSVSALTELPHCREFALEEKFADLGHVLHALIEEGKSVAAGLGITLHEDPWEMNKIGAQTDHPPSMLYDINHHLRTEVDFLGGAIAREAESMDSARPLHTRSLPPDQRQGTFLDLDVASEREHCTKRNASREKMQCATHSIRKNGRASAP